MFGINPRPPFHAHSQFPPQPMTSGFQHYALGGALTKVSGGLSPKAPERHFLAPSLPSTSGLTPSWHPFLLGCHCSILQLSFCYSWILSSALYIQGFPEALPWGFLFSFFGQCQPFMWLQYSSMKSVLIFLFSFSCSLKVLHFIFKHLLDKPIWRPCSCFSHQTTH